MHAIKSEEALKQSLRARLLAPPKGASTLRLPAAGPEAFAAWVDELRMTYYDPYDQQARGLPAQSSLPPSVAALTASPCRAGRGCVFLIRPASQIWQVSFPEHFADLTMWVMRATARVPFPVPVGAPAGMDGADGYNDEMSVEDLGAAAAAAAAAVGAATAQIGKHGGRRGAGRLVPGRPFAPHMADDDDDDDESDVGTSVSELVRNPPPPLPGAAAGLE